MPYSRQDTLRTLARWWIHHAAKGSRMGGAGEITAGPKPSKISRVLKHTHKVDDFLQAHPSVSERRPPKLVGMRPAKILAPIFVRNDPKNAAMSQQMLAGGVFGLMLQDIAWLRAHPETPDLYDAGISYKPERRREYHGHATEYGEEWQTIPWVIYRGYGDCEDLGAWRTAELRYRYRINATPFIKTRQLVNGFWRAHVVVRWPNGQIEDPSAKLGMYTFHY